MYRVDEANCTGCGECQEACPAGAIALVNGRAHIDLVACAECGICASACPQAAITMAVSRAQTATTGVRNLPAVVPSAVESADQAHRVEIELPPAEPRRSRFWPIVGSGMVWAAHELLPAILQAWQETSGLAGDRSVTGRRLAARGGSPARRQRMRWRNRANGAVRRRLDGGPPDGGKC